MKYKAPKQAKGKARPGSRPAGQKPSARQNQQARQPAKHRYRRPKRPARWPWVVMVLVMMGVIALAVRAMLGPAQPAMAPSSPSATRQPAATPAPTAAPTPSPTPAPTATPAPESSGEAITSDEAAQLTALLDTMPGSISVWLQDIETGQTYTYKPDNGFYCASTLKAPYALWLCLRDENGDIDLNYSWGGKTGWERIGSMISVSSNGAAHDLGEMWPGNADTGFADFLEDLGFTSPEGCEVVEEGIHGWVTGEDGGRAMRTLYDYFGTGSDNALRLKEAFLAANHDLLWCPTTAAKKYGSWDKALHDMVIVYDERPYILSMFTDWGDTEVAFPEEGKAHMQEVGKLAAQVIQQDP